MKRKLKSKALSRMRAKSRRRSAPEICREEIALEGAICSAAPADILLLSPSPALHGHSSDAFPLD
jgi:hypothetical protein